MKISMFATTRFVLTFFLAVFLLAGCKKEPTIWNSEWSAPIVSDTLSLKNLVNDSTLELNGSGSYNVILSRKLLDLNLNDVVAIPDTTIKKALTIAFPTLNIPPGFTLINSAEENDISAGDAELKSFTVKEGSITFTVYNPIETSVEFDIFLPGTIKNGQEFSESYNVPAANGSTVGEASMSFDLSGYNFDLTGLTNDKHNLFVSQISVTADPNGQTVTMTNSDSIKFDVQFNDIKLDYARGYFGQSFISDTITQNLDLLAIYESGLLDLPNMSLDLVIENGVKVGGQSVISLVSNENVNNNAIALNHNQIGNPFNIDPATGSWSSLTPSVKTINFNSSNSNIESYIENLGNKHTLGYSIQLNPWGNVSGGWDELFPNSTLSVGINLNMPLKIGFNNLVLKDTFDVDFSQQSGALKIIDGSLIVKGENTFPMEANLKIHLINSNNNVEFTIDGNGSIGSSLFGTSVSSQGLQMNESEIAFTLSQEMIDKLPDIKYICVESVFNSPDPVSGTNELLDIPENAFLGIKIITQLQTQNEL